jgi:hypothetical protein
MGYKFSLEKREIQLAIAFGVLGFIFSMRQWIKFLDQQSVLMGFLIYYGIIYLSLLLLAKLGFVIMGTKMKHWPQALGLLLIMFSFFVIFNWESPYVNIVAKGNADNVSPVYFQAEDGITWSFWNDTLGVKDVEQLRLLTFVLTPMLTGLLGGLLLMRRPVFSADGGM